ncbi:sulfotransferase [Deltaproteobacteria bacterium]|nr:sulfotransferase [Deltaproteobacteria bacterium]
MKLFLSSIFPSIRYQKNFKDIEKYCTFIGYPRSGHSLVGSLMDAHPNMVISHELDALHYVKAGFVRNQIFYLILRNSAKFTSEGREWLGYSYQVPNQWQGRSKRLLVIGDKKGGGNTQRFKDDPALVHKLNKRIRMPIKFIHVVRNPFDNISGIATRVRMKLSLEESIEYYFSLCTANENLKQHIPGENFFEMKHENLVSQPEQILRELCRFLELECNKDYLRDCSSVIFKSPHSMRQKVGWTSELIKKVKHHIKMFPFLKGYSF